MKRPLTTGYQCLKLHVHGKKYSQYVFFMFISRFPYSSDSSKQLQHKQTLPHKSLQTYFILTHNYLISQKFEMRNQNSKH